jgi:hypothetical protein
MWQAAIPLGVSLAQTLGGAIGSTLTKEPKKGYEVSPELQAAYNRAQQNANTGYSASERAQYLGDLAATNNMKYRMALGQGGLNNSQAISAAINSGNIHALNQFAANDANLRRQNQRYADQFANQFQSIKNQNTNLNWQNYYKKAQAWGGALQAGLNNMSLFGVMQGDKLGQSGQGSDQAPQTQQNPLTYMQQYNLMQRAMGVNGLSDQMYNPYQNKYFNKYFGGNQTQL